jgi:hypothetical protein
MKECNLSMRKTVGEEAMKLVLPFLALLTFVAGCPNEPPIDERDCTDDPRTTDFSDGLAVDSATGLFSVRFDLTSPPTPDQGDNVWELAIDSDSSTVTEAVRVKAWMPDHGHGTRPLWNEGARLPVSSLHRIGPFDLFMPGVWEFTIEATVAGVTDEAKVAFCITDELPEPDAGVNTDAGVVECNVTAPSECTDPSLTYSEVEPIIMQTCVGCHNGATENWPLTTYNHVADWFAEIRGMMLACTMPPPDSGIPMADEDRELILMWIRCGFQP